MKNKLKVYYADINNMGDQLNPMIINRVFGYEVCRRSFLSGELCAIGSGLDRYTLHGTPAMVTQQRINGLTHPRVYVWGTGFINYAHTDPRFFKRKMVFRAVRGKLSLARVEKLMGHSLDIPLGDGGILADRLINAPVQKRYAVGIIPHVCDLDYPEVTELAGAYENSVIINVKDDPYFVLRQIAECETVLSSSLHGLIVADSFGIPNRHVVFSDRPLGDGFKFDDYYSAYDAPHIITDLRVSPAPSPEEIVRYWPLTVATVEKKKRELLAAFPFPSIK